MKRKSDTEPEFALVYSTEGGDRRAAAKIADFHSTGPYPTQLGDWHARIERKGRGGKTVTVIARLPKHAELLKDLCVHLKKVLGCGGTFLEDEKGGIIELQGDRRERLKEAIDKFSIQKMAR